MDGVFHVFRRVKIWISWSALPQLIRIMLRLFIFVCFWISTWNYCGNNYLNLNTHTHTHSKYSHNVLHRGCGQGWKDGEGEVGELVRGTHLQGAVTHFQRVAVKLEIHVHLHVVDKGGHEPAGEDGVRDVRGCAEEVSDGNELQSKGSVDESG